MLANASAIALAGVSGADFKAAHAELLHDRSYQFALQGPLPPPPVPFWLRWLSGPLTWIAPYVGWLLWAALGIGVILILALVVRGFWENRKGKKAASKAPGPQLSDWRPDAGKARVLLSDADRLAAEGRFAEAVRLLLHRSIEEIEQRRPTLVAVAYTSRDIARLDRLPPRAREAFGRIARQVEHAVFGQHPVDASVYDACRAAYSEFAFPDAWAGA